MKFMDLRLWLCMSILFFSGFLGAQELERKADLGIDWVNAENGVQVVTVYDGHIGADMGLQPGDIITEYGGIKVPHMGALMYWFTQSKMGDKFLLTVRRNSNTLYLSGTKTLKPYEVDVLYDQFSIKGGQIRTLVNRPKGLAKAPVVLFIQDYTCHSIDLAGRDFYPIRRIAEDFASNGYAFVRVENMGIGDSKTKRQCYEIGYKEEGEVFCKALNYIEGLDFIDQEHIYILAHGFGGNQVLQAIKCKHPKKIIFWGLYLRFTNEICLPMRNERYWEEVKVTENLNEWTALDIRILLIHPEFDEFDHDGADARRLQQFLEPREEKEVTYSVFPEASHFFLRVNSMDNPDMTLGSYLNPGFLKDHYHEGIVPYMIEWLQKSN